MIQAIQPSGPQWDVRFLPAAPRGARAARPLQSATAAALLAQIRAETGIASGPSSKAHSRALAAAAVAPGGSVGIDVEHFTPGRPIQAIARYLMGAPAHNDEAAYRAFTFREAYFKALGAWPARGLVQAAAASAELCYQTGEVNVLHERIGDDFLLTLVWRD